MSFKTYIKRAMRQLGAGWVIPDSSGTIQANITPRTGTVSELLAAIMSNGEIATANDHPVAVMQDFNGNKQIFGVGTQGIIAGSFENFTVPADSTDYILTFSTLNNAVHDIPDGIVDVANGYILTPDWVAAGDGMVFDGARIRLEMQRGFLGGDNNSITFRVQRAASAGPTNWQDIVGSDATIAVVNGTVSEIDLDVNALASSIRTFSHPGHAFRIVANNTGPDDCQLYNCQISCAYRIMRDPIGAV